MTDEQVFELIGEEIAKSQRFGSSVKPKQKQELGLNWLRSNITTLRGKICGNKTIEDLASKEDTVPLIAALSPLLGLHNTALSVTTISVIISRIGVRRFCATDWMK
jgi:hypothetical protein